MYWHSSAHILGEAMERFYGGCLCYGPPIENGFYYDMFLDGQKWASIAINSSIFPYFFLYLSLNVLVWHFGINHANNHHYSCVCIWDFYYRLVVHSILMSDLTNLESLNLRSLKWKAARLLWLSWRRFTSHLRSFFSSFFKPLPYVAHTHPHTHIS